MANVSEVHAEALIKRVAEEIKKNDAIKPPEWAKFVKTGMSRERVPEQPDWWYIRAAAILRKLYFKPLGVSRLRVLYGGKKNRGYKPEKFYPASGSIIRKILQQLEEAGYAQKSKKGRELTAEGRRLLDKLAKELS
ncbi:MAG: 30S ribosomal protein S19e [Candidatus Nanohaloarchaeota archaeon]|nr:30S ribosomal protein S19e [Candidatus Nanohaloarchaeota archaeon]